MNLPPKLAGVLARQREQAAKQRERLGVEARDWYRIVNAADSDEAEVMLYDEIGGWWGYTADEFIRELRQITTSKMRVRVNSPGGSVFEGIAIANALRSHPATVTVQVDGIAASIASVIAMAADRIEMAPQTMMMIHDASGLCYGNAADMAEMEELLDLISDNIADAYAARAGGTREQWRDLMRNESWYLPDEAVAAGLADEAIAVPQRGEPVEPAEPDEDPMARHFDLAAYGYTGPPQPEPPKPAPPSTTPVPAAGEPALTADIRSLIGEEIAAQLAAAVAPATEEPPPTHAAAPDEPVTEVRGEHGPELVPFTGEEPVAAEPVDAWAAAVARFTQPDPWAAAAARFTRNTSASSAATNAA